MTLAAVYSRNRRLTGAVEDALPGSHVLARSPSWDGFRRLVRERPVSVGLVDLGSFRSRSPEAPLRRLRRDFPSLGLVALARTPDDPVALFRLGRAGLPHLILLTVDRLEGEVPRVVERARENGTTALVVRRLSLRLPRWPLGVVRAALDGVHRHWDAATFAASTGYSRPFLSVRLKEHGLPSVGRLQVWARLLHAGRWLPEPGRTGESVSRQLEYANGATFRRALRSYTGATPTEVVADGGLAFVLDRFLADCSLGEPRLGPRVSVA